MFQFAKFASVGVMNTIVDFAVLNILILLFGLGLNGGYYVYFKIVSFLAAVVNSYVFNKYWVFEKKEAIETKEPLLFVFVSVIGLIVNVTVSSGVFKLLGTMENIAPFIAVNGGAIVGTLCVLLFNFVGYKFFVFKTHKHV